MEHFKELTSLVYESGRLEALITVTSSIGQGRDGILTIARAEPGSDSFPLIAKRIGQEKFNSILKQFSGLLALELMEVKKDCDAKISTFEIVKH